MNLKFQTDASVLAKINRNKEAAAAVKEYCKDFPGDIEAACGVCEAKLSSSFRFNSDKLSAVRGEGCCSVCSTAHTLFHFVQYSDNNILKIEYFYNPWPSDYIGKCKRLWALSEFNKEEYFRMLLIAFPPIVSGPKDVI